MYYSCHPELNEEEEEKEGVLNLRIGGNTFAACDGARRFREKKTGIPYPVPLTHDACQTFCPFRLKENADIACFDGLLELYCKAHAKGDKEEISSLARRIAELEPREEYESAVS